MAVWTLLADLHVDIETQLSTSDLELRLIDRLDLLIVGNQNLLNRQVVVVPLGSIDTGQYGRGNLVRIQDNLRIDLCYQIRPMEQKKSMREALTLEEQIRVLLTKSTFIRDIRLTYTGTPVRQLTDDGGWYTIQQTYTTRRDAPLGGL